ncbi:MAG: hypothetical protein ACOX5R_01530 [bacterium]
MLIPPHRYYGQLRFHVYGEGNTKQLAVLNYQYVVEEFLEIQIEPMMEFGSFLQDEHLSSPIQMRVITNLANVHLTVELTEMVQEKANVMTTIPITQLALNWAWDAEKAKDAAIKQAFGNVTLDWEINLTEFVIYLCCKAKRATSYRSESNGTKLHDYFSI